MSQQEPSLDSRCKDAILDAAEHGWDALLDKADQPSNPFAEGNVGNGKEKSTTART